MQVGPAQTDANNGQMDSLIVDLSTALDESEKSFRRKRHHRRRASRGDGGTHSSSSTDETVLTGAHSQDNKSSMPLTDSDEDGCASP